jgi:hypothetical protein
MATAAYIADNAPNDDEHMQQLRALALEGVRVLQTTNEQGGEPAQRRNSATTEQPRRQLAAPVVVPRPQVAEPINGELRHGLAQHRVDTARTHREARRYDSEGKRETLDGNNGELCGAECFCTFIRSTPLPNGIKISKGIAKFNEQQTGETLRSYISSWLNLRNTDKNISLERGINAFWDGLIQWDFRETLGRAKPKTIDHLMSLANEWADGKDSIMNTRSRRCSPNEPNDAKEQFLGARPYDRKADEAVTPTRTRLTW